MPRALLGISACFCGLLPKGEIGRHEDLAEIINNASRSFSSTARYQEVAGKMLDDVGHFVCCRSEKSIGAFFFSFAFVHLVISEFLFSNAHLSMYSDPHKQESDRKRERMGGFLANHF